MATLVLDNGAYTAKIGYSQEEVSVIPNCQFRSKTSRLKTFTANQLDEIKDPSGLFYILPFQKGYLVNWDVQRKVWDHLFGKEMFKVEFADTSVVITEPYFNFTSIQESMNEILFEEYQFQSALRINAGSLSAHHYFHSKPSELCCLVVDTGFSFTHIAPYCRSRKMKESIHRINVGGKLLTNHLKEIISYRQLHVMDETHVINQVKEDVCYVSQHFYKDLEIAQMKGEENTVMRDYVLPDFSTIKKGFCKPREEMVYSGKYKTGEQILRLANERFAVPEILFQPSDIGIQEMGVPEAIINSIQSLPEGQLLDAASLLPEHCPDRRKCLVTRLQRAPGGRAAIACPGPPPSVSPATCKSDLLFMARRETAGPPPRLRGDGGDKRGVRRERTLHL
ncbi:actin-related protein 6 isoform X2 [Betta splendens]|uniref:Actin-related protein 6 isoform X2 n=1 Tax=Betta splendens TaxID=158456 RepID=A0A6P7MSI2_BETSP|nr:actin-related protein 6 isoform X2 [Betta splendens]